MANQAYYDKVNDFCDKLRQRRIDGSLAAAKGTAELMRQLVTSSRLNDPHYMLEEVRRVGAQIQSAKPIELVIGNIVRRVMHIIREETEEEPEEEVVILGESLPVAGGLSRALNNKTLATRGRAFSLHNLLDQALFEDIVPDTSTPNSKSKSSPHTLSPTNQPYSSSPSQHHANTTKQHSAEKKSKQQSSSTPWDRKQEVIDGVNDLLEELKDIDATIAMHAPEHIHANEIILTFGYSRTVAAFLRRAREKREFQVIVAEGAPTLQGYTMANELATFGIHTTAISDAAIYAMMGRVNKVVVSAHALLADGGVMAPVGMSIVAAAAKKHNVPFVVLVGIYKLSPHFPNEPGVTFNDFKEPSAILPYTEQAVMEAEVATATAAAAALASCLEEDGEDGGVTGGHILYQRGRDYTYSNNKKPFLQVHNPSYDYVPPDLISLFITDHGHGFMPSYVYRQLSEFYHRQDYHMFNAEEMDGAKQ